ncbi:MAG: Transcription termination/antitermination protein NusG [Phycisphaerae bacterium]|nr:Transcription termination/antitermination protein NusG [Phycisphaerae bacterium]
MAGENEKGAPATAGDDAQQPAAAANPPAAPPRAATAAGEVEMFRPGMLWYVLKVASNKEDQVRSALERKVKIEGLESRVGRIVVPTQREKRMRAGAARVFEKKLYPGYVFVEMSTEPDGSIPENVWFVIKETTGVGDFIGSGGKPSAMKSVDVEKMLAAAIKRDETPTLANLNFKPGDKVKIREGPFENFEGTVDEINPQKGTVRVIVTIFGRATQVDIEYWQVELV